MYVFYSKLNNTYNLMLTVFNFFQVIFKNILMVQTQTHLRISKTY